VPEIQTTQWPNAGKIFMPVLANFLQGRTSYEELNLHRGDDVYQKILELETMYAPDTTRVYLDKIAEEASPVLPAQIKSCNTSLLKKTQITPLDIGKKKYIPVDIDVSTMDNSGSKKEGVGYTYAGYDGYSPNFAYIGREGNMLGCEMREGTQHCQKGTAEFIKDLNRQIDILDLKQPVLFRLDSGNDAIDTIGAILSGNHSFIIKRNIRRESPEKLLATAKTYGYAESPREGKTVWTGVVSKNHPRAEKIKDISDGEFNCVFQVTERDIDKHGNRLIFPEIDAQVWWTDLNESAETIIDLYKDHATCEQFHSELKTDMNIERLPSGKFSVNSILLQLAMIAFNILRFIGQTALAASEKLPVILDRKRMRLRKVISDLIHIACKIVKHSGKYIMKVCEKDPWLPILQHLVVIAEKF
jgi:hypothetical protein